MLTILTSDLDSYTSRSLFNSSFPKTFLPHSTEESPKSLSSNLTTCLLDPMQLQTISKHSQPFITAILNEYITFRHVSSAFKTYSHFEEVHSRYSTTDQYRVSLFFLRFQYILHTVHIFPFCSFSITALSVRSFPYMGFHTTDMLMPLTHPIHSMHRHSCFCHMSAYLADIASLMVAH